MRSSRAIRSVVLTGVLSVLCAHASAAIVEFDSLPGGSLEVGSSFSLQLSGREFLSTLDGGGIGVTFDPGVLRLSSVEVDTTTWEFFSSNGTIDNTTGSVVDVLFASFEERVGSFPIASFTFEALAVGATSLLLSESLLNPFASGGALLPVDFGVFSLSVVDGTPEPEPTPVPAPAALWLMVMGLGGLGAGRMLRSRS